MTFVKWAGIVFISLIFFLILVIALINWNWVRDVAARQVSEKLGRTLIIEGNLSVDWSKTLHVRVEQIRLENVTWSKQPYMFELAALDFHIDLVELIKGRLIFPRVTLIKPRVFLEKSFEGEPNWDLPLDLDVELPLIKRLIIDDSRMVYRDLSTNTADITLTFFND